MREFTDGATAIARGAVDAGCTFFAGYPITPASAILMTMMREMPKVGGVAIQAEDEIASLGMCIGATLCGSRALTATSGPGLSLYSENIGLAIQGEVPLVIVDVQRMGPGTGAATTVSQGDVQFVRWGSAGGYPIVALCPSSVAECYGLTRRAFDLAERFRTPVFLLTDKELNLTTNTVALEAYEATPVRDRAPRCETGSADDPSPARPYRFEPADAVAPLAQYGEGEVVRFTGSSHDEQAFITKDPATMGRLNRHLVAKIEEHREELELVTADLEPGARTLLVAYGITAGALREAVARLRRSGTRVSALVLQSLWPTPERALLAAMEGIERVVVAELNGGQMLREVQRLARGVELVGLQRIDGELITPAQIEELVR